MSDPNFLAEQDAIVARITEHLMTPPTACLRKIAVAAEMANIPEQSQLLPAVYVVYDGLGVGGDAPTNEFAVEVQRRWITTVAVRNAAAQNTAERLTNDAGLLLRRLWDALHGWRPGPDYSPLVPVSPPRPYHDSEYAYVPLAWQTTRSECAQLGA
jgi:hypothetical protein